MEYKVDGATWVRVTITVAIIGCIGLLGAAVIGIIPNFLPPRTLPTSTPNIQSASVPSILPTLTPFSAQAPSVPTLVIPTPLSITTTPVPVQGSQVAQIPQATFTEFYSGNLTVTIFYVSKSFNQISAYISSPGYPIVTIISENVGYKTIYAANDSYEIQFMGITPNVNGEQSVDVSVLRLDNRPKAKTPVIIVSKEQQDIGVATTGTFSNGSLIIAVIYASKSFNQVSAEISVPGYDVYSFTGEPIGYKTQYQTDKKYEIQVVNISGSVVTFTVTILQ